MSKWVVRRAVEADREWLLKQCESFISYLDMELPFNAEHINDLVTTFINSHETHYALVATNDGVPYGVAAAVLQPHLFNPNVSVFVELMWWVEEDKRKSRAGLILLDALDTIGRKVADYSSIATEAKSQLNEKTLIKRGFKKQELAYIRKN